MLTDEERSALVLVGPRKYMARLGRVKRMQLHRLLEPIDAAWQQLEGSNLVARIVVTRALVRATAISGIAFWGWDKETWLRIFRTSTCRPYRVVALALAHELGGISVSEAVAEGAHPTYFARRMFGPSELDAQVRRMADLAQSVGYKRESSHSLPGAVARLLLMAERCELEALTIETIESAHASEPHLSVRRAYSRIASILHAYGMLERPIRRPHPHHNALDGVHPSWAEWCQRWRETAVVGGLTASNTYYAVLRAGRWLAEFHPEIESPEQWTRQMAATYVASVDRSNVGDYASPNSHFGANAGNPLDAKSKDRLLAGMRRFFGDCHEWGWCPVKFNPQRAFATPRAVKALIGRDPRVIANDIWAKLMWAGMNLTEEDSPKATGATVGGPRKEGTYPLAMLRALSITWLFAGLRSGELVRLRVGCIRWQEHDAGPAAGTAPTASATCLLDVPVNKTSGGYTKPVDPIVGRAIADWEAKRMTQPLLPDKKTGEKVDLLFAFRGRPVQSSYLNRGIIRMLCKKAGVPTSDARGAITSHRARHTIATQLYNAKDPMTLYELQEWLGHRTPSSTQHYVKITQSKLAAAYSDAGYFARNVRAIEVLVDRQAAEDGSAAAGRPWQYFDLGHGYCTYSFFEQCQHRMACARCDFYVPKHSERAQLLEAKANLQRMLIEIPLTDDERAAVEDGQVAVERLLERLVDVPTPAGPTPRSLGRQLPVLQSAGQRKAPRR
ncbi:MAG: tyrosine-type recombinase/integrase [Candidatus Dormibacteraceae bacterium]